MTNKMRRTKIMIERHEITVIRQRGKQTLVYCECCQSTVATITPDEVAKQLSITLGEVIRLSGMGGIHFINALGHDLPLICAGLPHQ
jgi:hypothetical protein